MLQITGNRRAACTFDGAVTPAQRCCLAMAKTRHCTGRQVRADESEHTLLNCGLRVLLPCTRRRNLLHPLIDDVIYNRQTVSADFWCLFSVLRLPQWARRRPHQQMVFSAAWPIGFIGAGPRAICPLKLDLHPSSTPVLSPTSTTSGSKTGDNERLTFCISSLHCHPITDATHKGRRYGCERYVSC